MSQFARVDSIAALKKFRASLCQFAHVAAVSIEEVDMEIRQAQTWLQHDRYPYWRGIVRDKADAHTRAKLALNQRKLFELSVQGTPSSCVDEKKALRIAEQGLREAEHRFARAKFWIGQMDRDLNDYKGRVKGLSGAVQAEVPKALAALDRMVDSLEAYVALAPPEAPGPAEQPDKDSVLWHVPDEPQAETGPSSGG
jgi:hypothetical protein